MQRNKKNQYECRSKASLCLYGIYTTMPRDTKQPQPLDYGGVLLIISFLLFFITPLIYGRSFQWPWWIFALIGVSLLFLWLFIQWEIRREKHQKPALISIQLLHNKSFSYNLPIILFYNFTAGLFICYPYYLQAYLHWEVMAAGLAILPYGLGFFVGPLLFTKGNKSSSFWIPIALGLLIISFIALGVTFYLIAQPFWLTHGLFLLAGLGHGLIMPVMMRESIHPITLEQAGQASGLVSTLIQVGSVLGGAIVGTLFFSFGNSYGFPLALAAALATIGSVQIIGLAFYYTNIKSQ